MSAALVIAILFCSGLAAAAPAEPKVELIDGVRHVRNGAEPLHGERTLHLEELWRVNVEDEDELIGYIADALAGPDGSVWLADQQLGQVLVYSAAGERRRTLGGEGEGPGEVNAPDQLLWLPGGGLGIRDRKPGQLTVIDREGTPRPSVHLKSADGEPLSSSFLMGARCRAGVLAVAGTIFRQNEDGAPTQGRFFSVFDAEGRERRRLLEAPSGFDFQNRTFDEPKNWFVDRGAFDVDPAGRVWFATSRDDYRIHVHDPDGDLVQVIERAYEPRRRTAEEKESLAGGARMMINGEMVQIDTRVGEYRPAIEGIHILDDGRIWVGPDRGGDSAPEGVVASYDVFDGEGRFMEVVHVTAEMDDEQDAIQVLDDGRWILLRNIDAAARTPFGGSGADAEEEPEAEDRPLEIVCLRPTRGS